MKNILFVLSIVAIMLFAGCASQPSAPSPKPVQQQPPPPAPAPVKNETPPAPLPAPEKPPAMEADKCTVEFQKDSSSVYYVMVKTASTKKLEVICPSGSAAEKRGELYFCTRLEIPNPAIAKLDGKECGRAEFLRSSVESAPAGKSRCTVLLAPSRITKGGTSQVTVQAYTQSDKDTLAYLCGTTEISEKAGGLVDTGKICRFDTAGTVEVYATINGERCGSKLLEVFDKTHECSVLSSSLDMVNGEYSYKAKVAGRGYSGSDLLNFKCYGIPHEVKVEGIPNSTDFIYEIECRGKTPLASPVPVKIGTDPCGELSLQE